MTNWLTLVCRVKELSRPPQLARLVSPSFNVQTSGCGLCSLRDQFEKHSISNQRCFGLAYSAFISTSGNLLLQNDQPPLQHFPVMKPLTIFARELESNQLEHRSRPSHAFSNLIYWFLRLKRDRPVLRSIRTTLVCCWMFR
jgi:hypothetical protein